MALSNLLTTLTDFCNEVNSWGLKVKHFSFLIPLIFGRWFYFPVQNLLDAWLGLGTQPRYKAPGDLQVDYERSD